MRWPWRRPAYLPRPESAPQPYPEPEPAPRPAGILIDAHTRTWWAKGGEPATLVEAAATEHPAPRRKTSAAVAEARRPRANPAFAEAVFVELIRGGQYERAYDLLTPECQVSWGGYREFAAAQKLSPPLEAVVVKGSRVLQNWVDPVSGLTYPYAAELDAEYTLGGARQQRVIRRTVHLVGHEGRWRSLCYRQG